MNRAFTKSMSLLALATAVTLSSCQKEELTDNQFDQQFASVSPLNGQLIDGQYMVVFKNGANAVPSNSSSQGFKISQVAAARMRANALETAGIKNDVVSQVYEGTINGFAAKLSNEQLASLRKNPDVAYIEQDRVLMLGANKDTSSNKGGTIDPTGQKGGGKREKTLPGTSEPAPTEPAPTEPAPTEPAPTEPAPTEPAPTEPAPTEPAPTEPAPTEPAPTAPAPTEPAPAYTKITPMAGETLPWNIERVGYGDGTGKTVWVIDSGVDTDHPDLNVDLARSFSFIYGQPSIEDGYGHGTSVAGIIAAKNNGSGIIGVAANATIVAMRVFDDAGAGTVSRAVQAVNYVAMYGKPGDVVNLSLGAGISSTLDDAVKAAAAKGILFALAAGNSGVDCSGTSPARVDATGVYTISAIDTYNKLWASSNYGASVDFAAPGVNVLATTKNGSFSSGHGGTSMAAPHVAGILLLRGEVFSQGNITGDKDNTPDPIAWLN
ncbi:S8 family serine peptidase [Pontibacter akesuensis]|uniref:Peptidase inhibitor I9 n=1 Tax=Pontibacter akesuensis TaxID=388950 RepID=A0A1I7FR07_9BACT|nr:S8 family serine peptidase [Pontibacter akesuensis]GHA60981.1 hypothetical protein GCM10007389_11590 [Pontibacter akesuensis]SFU38575.1 Peptidase inhibitor I9 [Pontibacter akesuensis]